MIKYAKLLPLIFIFTVFFSKTEVRSQSSTDKKPDWIDKIVLIQDSDEREELENTINWLKENASEYNGIWFYHYYIALGYLKLARLSGDDDYLEDNCNIAYGYIEKADSINSENDEIITLKAYIISTRIRINPMARGPVLGPQVRDLLTKALELNACNPRIFVLKAEAKIKKPVLFGGGCQNAKPFIEKADNLYLKANFNKSLLPKWGYHWLLKLKEDCFY